jgi:hypothetical protein
MHSAQQNSLFDPHAMGLDIVAKTRWRALS